MSALAEVPEVEMSAKARRRRFTAEYKRKILQQLDSCTKSGEIGALLRREGGTRRCSLLGGDSVNLERR